MKTPFLNTQKSQQLAACNQLGLFYRNHKQYRLSLSLL